MPGILNIAGSIASRQPETGTDAEAMPLHNKLLKLVHAVLRPCSFPRDVTLHLVLNALNMLQGLFRLPLYLLIWCICVFTADFGDYNRLDSLDFLQKLLLFPIVSILFDILNTRVRLCFIPIWH